MITGAALKTVMRRKVLIDGAYEISNDKCSIKLTSLAVQPYEKDCPITVYSTATMTVTDRTVFVEPNPILLGLGVVQGQRIYSFDDGTKHVSFEIYNYNSLKDVQTLLADLPWLCKLYVEDRI